jgi:hypothetical protein
MRSHSGMKLDECEVVGRELVVAGCHTPTVLNLIEEPLDQVASPPGSQQPPITAA